jgi:hypothetical protein
VPRRGTSSSRLTPAEEREEALGLAGEFAPSPIDLSEAFPERG